MVGFVIGAGVNGETEGLRMILAWVGEDGSRSGVVTELVRAG